jgi:hypothetical protein
MAVRDRNWGTVPARVTIMDRQAPGRAVNVRFTCAHQSDDVGFRWDGTVTAKVTSPTACTVTYAMVGEATRDFLANRVGFCVLHPLSVTGQSVSLRSPTATSEGRFPLEVSPFQPFRELTGMAYGVGDAKVDITFEGELFETEDQRNWTDASFKTYCPPLRLPYPRWFRSGQELSQKVVIELTGPQVPPRDKRRAAAVEVNLGAVGDRLLPRIGTALGKPQDRDELNGVGPLLSHLGPAHLHVVVDPALGDWESDLQDAARAASAAGTGLQVELVADDTEGVEAVARTLAGCTKAAPSMISRVMLFDGGSSVTTRPLAAAWRSVAQSLGLPQAVFGGSRANFAELNRSSQPLELLSGLTFALNPQVHAFSDDEIVETLPVQQVVARQASAIAPGLTLHVGPVTLQPRFNPVATQVDAHPEPPPDPRLYSQFAAAWTLASVAALAHGGAQELTYYDVLGRRGMMPTWPASPSFATFYPVCEVLRALCGHRGYALLDVPAVQAGVVGVLGLAREADLDVFVANLSPVAQVVRLEDVGANFVRTGVEQSVAARTRQGNRGPLNGRPFRSEPFELAPHEVAVCTTSAGGVKLGPGRYR